MLDPIELLKSLTRAPFGISDETQAAHKAAISTRLGAHAAPTVQLSRRWRRLVASFATAALVSVPSVAVATSDTLPGERGYQAKLTVENLWSVFDKDIIAEHRIAELAALAERDAVTAEAIRAAQDATEQHPELASSVDDILADLAPTDELADSEVEESTVMPAQESDDDHVSGIPDESDEPIDVASDDDDESAESEQPVTTVPPEPTTSDDDASSDGGSGGGDSDDDDSEDS